MLTNYVGKRGCTRDINSQSKLLLRETSSE